MSDPAAPSYLTQRIPSHIPGLDTVLGGGFLSAGVYMIHGIPGSGKTIFANQLCFGHVAGGGRALYVTLLAESHARLLQHLRPMRFFDESVIPSRLSYISAFGELESEGLKGLVTLLRRAMRTHEASLLVLDGLVNATETAATDRELKKFIHEIQTNAIFHDCTVLLLTSGIQSEVHAEHTMVDGLIALEDRLFDFRSERYIQIRKFRGAEPLRGKHAFKISDEGIRVFPRIESVYRRGSTRPRAPTGFLSTGVESVDALLEHRGLPRASTTIAVGSTGTGKTTLGLQFLSQSTVEEPGLHYGFFESPERLHAMARSYGLDFAALEQAGAVSMIWHSFGEHILDELGHQLLQVVRERGVKRLVIDGLSGFFESVTYGERIGRFLACLLNELRDLGVTVLMALETRDVVTSSVPLPYGISALIDNLVFLRFVEEGGEVQRLLSVIKIRGSGFNAGIHRFDIDGHGAAVDGLYTAGGDVIPSARPVDGDIDKPSRPPSDR